MPLGALCPLMLSLKPEDTENIGNAIETQGPRTAISTGSEPQTACEKMWQLFRAVAPTRTEQRAKLAVSTWPWIVAPH